HQQKGMISLSPPTICNSAFLGYDPGLQFLSDVIFKQFLPRLTYTITVITCYVMRVTKVRR
ncbi:hypothetical protein, partial [Pseudomonas aeruginosa]